MPRDYNWLRELKLTLRCAICGSSTDINFHHTDRDNKILPVGTMNRKYGKARVLAEIEKCIPLCTSCHTNYPIGTSICKYGAECCPLIGTPDCKCK